jgi:hypothetical protein
MGSHDPFEHLKHKLWPKEGSDHQKSRITLISFHVGDMPHCIEKISTRVITLFWTSPQSKVCTQSYGLPNISRNWPKCNHYIYDYMRLLVIYNYIWTFLQLFLVLVIFATTLQLVCNYFGVHPSM